MAFGLRVAGVETDADSTRQQSEIIRSTSCPYELIHAVVVLHGSILRPQRRVSDVLGIPTLPSGQALSFAGQDAMAMSFAQDPCSFLSLFLLVQKPRAKEGLCLRMILLISRDSSILAEHFACQARAVFGLFAGRFGPFDVVSCVYDRAVKAC